MLKTLFTLFSFFSMTFSNLSHKPSLSYVCTKDHINYYTYQNLTLSLPNYWINHSQNVYRCDSFKRVGEYKISYKVTCGDLKIKRLIKERPNLKVKKVVIPKKFLKSQGVYRGFKNKHEYIICVKKDRKKIIHEHPHLSQFFIPFVKDA